MFIVKSLLLEIGLAMDAVAVSMANGLQNPKMKEERKMSISFAFGFFQFFMPVLGYFLLRTFTDFAPLLIQYISPISTLILSYIGLRMLLCGVKKQKNKEGEETSGNLLFQAVGTSVDALSLGFTFSLYSIPKVCISSLIIGIVTFILSYAAILVGKKFGTIYAGKADILGGIVLILVAILL